MHARVHTRTHTHTRTVMYVDVGAMFVVEGHIGIDLGNQHRLRER